MLKAYNRLTNWITDKKIAAVAVFFFLLSLLPVFYLAPYARPTGDDLGYGALTRAAWVESGSLLQVLKAAVQTVKEMYYGWNGDWCTVFLFSLMPEVFVTYSYWVVPYMMVGLLVLGTVVFLDCLLVKAGGISREYALIFSSLILFASIQFIPSTAIGMYWYVGAMHYIMPHALALFTIVFAIRFYLSGRKRNVIYASLCMFVVGGSSYFSSLLVFMVFFFLFVFLYRKRKDILYFGIPFAIGAAGFVVQCVSPGNKARAGAEFGFHTGGAVATIIESLKQGLLLLGSTFVDRPFVYVILFLCGVFGWQALLKSKSTFRFPCPFLFVVVMYGFYSAMYAPGIYSGVEVSGDPFTMVYLSFLLAFLLAILYVEGWVIRKLKEAGKLPDPDRYREKVMFLLLAAGVLVTAVNPGWFKNSVDKQVYDYVVSGQAQDYKKQIESYMEILLDDTIKEAYLIPINDDQGPLMHMPVTTDENNFTNQAMRRFYRKERVVLIEESNREGAVK